ncbi:MAG TPA: hypothetical protein VFX28_22300 [Methylomirabilota bacterium]|nr:hypothetical protein [Methylomirabilota bacterium]
MRATWSGVLAIALLGLAGAAALAASEAPPGETLFRGACYCRQGPRLDCLGELTERECDRRCREAICDEWFWLERRPCWNWGYGG